MEQRLNQVIGKVMEVTGMSYEYVLDEMTVGEMKEIYDDEMERIKFKEELINGDLVFPEPINCLSENVINNFYKSLSARYIRESTLTTLIEAGINVSDQNGRLLSITEVLRELGQKWDTYSHQQKLEIASQLGGGWHVNKVISFIEKQSKANKNAQPWGVTKEEVYIPSKEEAMMDLLQKIDERLGNIDSLTEPHEAEEESISPESCVESFGDCAEAANQLIAIYRQYKLNVE